MGQDIILHGKGMAVGVSNRARLHEVRNPCWTHASENEIHVWMSWVVLFLAIQLCSFYPNMSYAAFQEKRQLPNRLLCYSLCKAFAKRTLLLRSSVHTTNL